MTDYYDVAGRLTVLYDIDVVRLIHLVNGRMSYMFLTEGDLIEIEEDGERKTISVTEILETTICNQSDWKFGKSYFQDAYVKVRLSGEGNRVVNLLERSYKINEVLEYLKHGMLSQREATNLLLKFELEDG